MRTVELAGVNRSGLHARPANLLVETAGGFSSRVTVENLTRGSRAVDAKSILMLLTAGVQRGHRIRLAADGDDEDRAIEMLSALIEGGLGEGVEPG